MVSKVLRHGYCFKRSSSYSYFQFVDQTMVTKDTGAHFRPISLCFQYLHLQLAIERSVRNFTWPQFQLFPGIHFLLQKNRIKFSSKLFLSLEGTSRMVNSCFDFDFLRDRRKVLKSVFHSTNRSFLPRLKTPGRPLASWLRSQTSQQLCQAKTHWPKI